MTKFPTMHQRVVDELGRRIVGGAWGPGDPLPVEDALAAAIGVSRGCCGRRSSRWWPGDAARTSAHRHARAAPEHWNHLDPDVLRWKQAEDAAALLRDTGELRRIVEPEAARLAAERAGPENVRVLYDALAAMEAAAASPAAPATSRRTSSSTGPCSTRAATACSARWAVPWRSRCSTAS